MKITLLCHVMPYPPIHGGRVDQWRRIKALSTLGAELQLITWVSDTPKQEEIAEIEKYVKKMNIIPFKSTPSAVIRRLLDLFRYPLEVTSRIVRGKEFTSLLSDVRVFNPDVIFLDGLHGGLVAAKLSDCLKVPMIARSHNIEHLYYRRLVASATGLNKIKRYLSLSNLENYEKKVLKKSAFFYDISADDLKFWQRQGFMNGRYLPPIVEFPKDNQLENTSSQESENKVYDIVFLGNLNLENNVAGITWFINQVFPVIRSTLPNVTVLIAGSNPVHKVSELCEDQEGVRLSPNPASAVEVYKSGKVLINPVLTGSGVSIKSIEMMVYGKPIVSTPQGIAGLPEDVNKYFHIANDAPSFAAEIIQCLSEPQKADVDRELLESLFGYQVLEGVLSDIKLLSGKYSVSQSYEVQ